MPSNISLPVKSGAPSKLCITVVEDNESLCAVTVELLRQHGHRAVGVTSAEALSDEESNALIDVLLVDLNLPGENGFSLVRRYRAICPGLTIIVISSRDRIEDRLACYKAGADAFIAKPTHPDELLAIIQAHVRRRPDVIEDAGPPVPSATLKLRSMTLCGPLSEEAISQSAATILSSLALAPGRRLEHWQLIEALREDAEQYNMTALVVRVVRLRQLLKLVGLEGMTIRAMRMEGYQLCVPVIVA
ncbi:MAG: response regulator transcription factor [Rhodoferax sp.]|nr:response regulator transcription factor [Rhodoferax sp.]